MYPDLNESMSIGTFRYEGSDTTHYYAVDGSKFEISYGLWDALLQADGAHSDNLYIIGNQILPRLKRLETVQTSRFVLDDDIFSSLILFPIGS